ncbi:MAG TPA: alpha/beta hydrolase fold domain-containing protein, partial [Acidimicrobiales bacterium]|nr:alpha/beta hydrolase fold domain-containing protein [Acidimicrobiales bacterium]
DFCRALLPFLVRGLGVATEDAAVGGVPGSWYRPRGPARGTVVYLHGGGFVGTSPSMYALFVALLARHIGCEVFVADYRLAPEFPFPADLEDAVTVVEALLVGGLPPERLLVAGDSAGGGLVGSLLFAMSRTRHRPLAGAVLFSPEVDLRLDEPSVSDNAASDILPWNIPTAGYLHGRDPGAPAVSAVAQDVSRWPPTFVAFGGAEMFRDAIRRLVDHLRASGVEVVDLEEPGMFHVYPILAPWADATRRTFEQLRGFVDSCLAATKAAPVAADR